MAAAANRRLTPQVEISEVPLNMLGLMQHIGPLYVNDLPVISWVWRSEAAGSNLPRVPAYLS